MLDIVATGEIISGSNVEGLVPVEILLGRPGSARAPLPIAIKSASPLSKISWALRLSCKPPHPITVIPEYSLAKLARFLSLSNTSTKPLWVLI